MDISLKTNELNFGVRTVGVTVNNGKVLVQREKYGNEYALPGGTVKLGETTEEALIREYFEETGSEILIKRLLWTEESFWKYNEKLYHGIAFYYLIDILNDSTYECTEFVSQKDNCDIILGWIPIEDINNIIIYPEFIKEEINKLNDPPKHFISKE